MNHPSCPVLAFAIGIGFLGHIAGAKLPKLFQARTGEQCEQREPVGRFPLASSRARSLAIDRAAKDRIERRQIEGLALIPSRLSVLDGDTLSNVRRSVPVIGRPLKQCAKPR